jgi:hypothetical protein
MEPVGDPRKEQAETAMDPPPDHDERPPDSEAMTP